MTAMISLPTSHFGWLSGHIGKLTPDALNDYVNDFWQRSILFLDILRRRGNQREDMMAHRVASRARSDRTPAQDGATMQHTQRIPVRIRLTQVPPGGLISAGMTCTVIMKDGAAPEIGIGIKKAIAAAFSARCNFQHPSVKGTAQSLRCGFGYRVLRRALDDAAWLVEALVRMSVAIQSQFMTLHSTRCWALWMGLSLSHTSIPADAASARLPFGPAHFPLRLERDRSRLVSRTPYECGFGANSADQESRKGYPIVRHGHRTCLRWTDLGEVEPREDWNRPAAKSRGSVPRKADVPRGREKTHRVERCGRWTKRAGASRPDQQSRRPRNFSNQR